MNTSFLLGGLVGIAVTIAFEVVLAVVFDLPSRGVEDVTPSPSEAVGRFTGNVRLVPPTATHTWAQGPDAVITTHIDSDRDGGAA